MFRLSIALVLTSTLATPASAHVGHDMAFSLLAGLSHPLLGLDHLAAMLTVGLWASLAGGQRLWVWPLTFVAAMAAGGMAGYAGVALPFVEPVIAASVVVLGLLVATSVRAPIAIGGMLIGAFAVFHGHAHGAEAGDGAFAAYALGFLVATAALHAAGLALGLAIDRYAGRFSVRAAGSAVALLGIALFVR